MPRFQKSDSFVLQTTLPHPSEKEPEVRLNPEEDVKVSLTFASSKLVVPNVIMYDSKKKRSLQQLMITFYHDDFDVLRLSFHTTCTLRYRINLLYSSFHVYLFIFVFSCFFLIFVL